VVNLIGGTLLKIIYCMKFVEKDTLGMCNVSKHSIREGDGASRGYPIGGTSCSPNRPSQGYFWIVEFMFNGYCDSLLLLVLVWWMSPLGCLLWIL